MTQDAAFNPKTFSCAAATRGLAFPTRNIHFSTRKSCCKMKRPRFQSASFLALLPEVFLHKAAGAKAPFPWLKKSRYIYF